MRRNVAVPEDIAAEMEELAKVHRRSLSGEFAAAGDYWVSLHKGTNDESKKPDNARRDS